MSVRFNAARRRRGGRNRVRRR